MLRKKRRLTRKLLDTVIAEGKIFHSPILSLKAIRVQEIAQEKNSRNAASRFSAVASKKYFKTAVLRNKMRRRTYGALASLLQKFDSSDSAGRIFHCVLLMKPAALDLDQAALTQAIREIFVKSRILA